MGLENMFHAAAHSHWHKTAVVCHHQRISYHRLDTRSTQVAGMLLDILGVKQKKVLVLARNSISYLEVILGCFKADMVACPINWRLSPYELATLLTQEQFELIFYDGHTYALLHEAIGLCDLQINSYRLGGFKYESRIKIFSYEYHAIREAVNHADSDLALQYFTSGSTGLPKGVLHSHGSLMAYVNTYALASDWGENTVYETSASLFHLSGFSCLISLLLGNTLVLMDHFELAEFFTAAVEEGATRVSLVPTLVNALLHSTRVSQYDLSGIEKMVYGGSSMLPDQVEAAARQLSCDLEMAYGTTETCCISLLTAEDHRKILDGTISPQKLSSAGRPLSCVEVRVAGEDGATLPPNAVGEIQVKSPFLYQGYSSVGVHQALTADGYHQTGDIGYVDEDGYVYILDRKHDMIVCGGENIYPKEVEICIAKMANCISQVSVVGLQDSTWGEIVVAFVVPIPGAPVTESDIIAFCKHNIASYKKPKKVLLVEELPLDVNGKVSKRKLKAMLVTGI